MQIRLQYWRERRIMSIRGLARKAKVNPNTISAIEKGARPRQETAQKLADALGVTLDDLVDKEYLSHRV